jgi:ABC-type proline/glycine betaine transport system permease subunit
LKSWVWPNVSSRRQIHFALLEGYCAAIAAAALFAIIAHVGSYQIDTLSIIMELAYVAIFVGLAFGIERRSRTEAVAALSIYVLNFC